MNDILPKSGLTPHGTNIGFTNPAKVFDDASRDAALPYFQAQQYKILLARAYSVQADAIRTAGAQPDLQVQIWDRHYDADSADGVMTVGNMEGALENAYARARSWGASLIPYHLMFAKLKTMRQRWH